MCNKNDFKNINNDQKQQHNYKAIFLHYVANNGIDGVKLMKLGSSIISLTMYKEWLSCHYSTINYKMAFSFVLYTLNELMKCKKVNIDTQPLHRFIQQL